jgi:hypothetical protein
MNGAENMIVAEHWYASAAFQGFVTIILTLLTLIAALVALWIQLISSRRWLSYEIRAATPLVRAPAEVSKDLKIVYDGTTVKDPYFIELRLVNRGREDISSNAFDQGMPIRFDFGIDIVKLLQITLEPDEPRALKVKADGSAVEIGPGLIHAHQELSIALLADGSDITLRYSKPLAGVKIRPVAREDPATRGGMTLKTIAGWLAVAFVIWWILEDSTGAEHVVHNVGTFLTTAAHGISSFFASIR